MTSTTSPFHLVLLCGGFGARIGQQIPKQYLMLCEKPIALYSLDTFLQMPQLSGVVIVCHKEYENLFKPSISNKNIEIKFARPGILRQDSVFNGIQLIQGDPLVCIHDAARPFIKKNAIEQLVQAATLMDSAALGVPAKSTFKLCDQNQMVVKTLSREMLWEIQTPQAIRLNLLKEGFNYCIQHGISVTDDVSLVELIGKPTKIIEGCYSNIKITTPEDLNLARHMVNEHGSL